MENNSLNFSAEPKEAPNDAKKVFPRYPLSVILLIVLVTSAVFGAMFGFMAGGALNILFPALASRLAQSRAVNQNGQTTIENRTLIEEDSAVIAAAEKISPTVVSVVITKDIPRFRSFFDDPFDFFDSPTPRDGATERQRIGGGTGFFVSADGLIVTNKHVVEDPDADYTVVTSDGKEHPAAVLAKDPVQDIAVIKTEGSSFPIAELGDSDSVKVGQTVIAVGNSLGEFSNTVSKGIVSGLQRQLTASSGLGGNTERLAGIIQTDAAINFGNSGGPLTDTSGRVIGVNVAKAQGAENIGFAIPINRVKRIIDQVTRTGRISTPFLGVRYIPVDKDLQVQYNLPFDYGVLVRGGQQPTDLGVVPGSPADKAGVTENDIILEIDNQRITTDNQLSDLIALHEVGEQIAIKFWHKGEMKEASVVLEERK